MNKTIAYNILVSSNDNINNGKPSPACSSYTKYTIASLVALMLIGGVIAIAIMMPAVGTWFKSMNVPIAATGTAINDARQLKRIEDACDLTFHLTSVRMPTGAKAFYEAYAYTHTYAIDEMHINGTIPAKSIWLVCDIGMGYYGSDMRYYGPRGAYGAFYACPHGDSATLVPYASDIGCTKLGKESGESITSRASRLLITLNNVLDSKMNVKTISTYNYDDEQVEATTDVTTEHPSPSTSDATFFDSYLNDFQCTCPNDTYPCTSSCSSGRCCSTYKYCGGGVDYCGGGDKQQNVQPEKINVIDGDYVNSQELSPDDEQAKATTGIDAFTCNHGRACTYQPGIHYESRQGISFNECMNWCQNDGSCNCAVYQDVNNHCWKHGQGYSMAENLGGGIQSCWFR